MTTIHQSQAAACTGQIKQKRPCRIMTSARGRGGSEVSPLQHLFSHAGGGHNKFWGSFDTAD